MRNGIRNIAIFAHVDAGKTTLTEQLLFESGAIGSPGRVDSGTCCTDSLAVERKRGISVRTDTVSFTWRETRINLIDTPGHADFSAETGRALLALDAAVLMVSAVEGIQSQTRRLWGLLRDAAIPTILFINKIDRAGSDGQAVLAALRTEFTSNLVAMNRPVNEGGRQAEVESLLNENHLDSGVLEAIAETDDHLLSAYLDGDHIDLTTLLSALKKAVARTRLYPVLFGASIHHIGVAGLLDCLVEIMPAAGGDPEAPLSAVVFKIDHHPTLGRCARVRIWEGRIRTRDNLYNPQLDIYEKISRIERRKAGKTEDMADCSAGDLATVYGLRQSRSGDYLGQISPHARKPKPNTSLITVEVTPGNPQDYAALAAALQLLCDEEPELSLDWRREERQFHVSVMGRVQIEILQNILEERFGLGADFGPPQVIYRETPLREVIVEEDYTMPKPCWARVRFCIRPGLPGTGLVYRHETSQDQIARSYQQEIERSLSNALRQGPLGWEVTDIELTLTWAEDHVMHSRPGDFATASAMAIMKGLTEAGTGFLEPYLQFIIEVPPGTVPRVMGDMIQMRGEVGSNMVRGNITILEGYVPLASSLDYPIRLSSQSGGQGRISTSFAGYRPCSEELGVSRPYRGINPLDRAKFILYARKALG